MAVYLSTCGCASEGEPNWGHCCECGEPCDFIAEEVQ